VHRSATARSRLIDHVIKIRTISARACNIGDPRVEPRAANSGNSACERTEKERRRARNRVRSRLARANIGGMRNAERNPGSDEDSSDEQASELTYRLITTGELRAGIRKWFPSVLR